MTEEVIFGFSSEAWQNLAAALRQHAAQREIQTAEETPFGTRYTVEGGLETPDGRAPVVRTVWFIGTGADVPRFVTVYPLRRQGR